MDNSKNSKGNAETKPHFCRLQDYMFTKHDYRINLISNQLERKPIGEKDWELVNIYDVDVELYTEGFKAFKDPIRALFASKMIVKYDPFITYFEGLPVWNSTKPDYIEQLASYVQTDDTWWWNQMFKKWLVRCVGQAIGTLPFNKQCLTLVGKQNDGKTTFLDFLVPQALQNYVKKGFDFGSKDGKFSLVQNFLVNLDELASFDKKELNNEFKSILTESTVKYRPLFQNTEVPFQRRASFVASTNQFEFLTDETGNVRWLPFVVKDIKHDAGGPNGYGSMIDMDNVWSQAYALSKDPSFKCEMNQEEISHQGDLNKRFLRTTTEMEVISKYFAPSSKDEPESVFMTPSEMEEYLKGRVSLRLHRNQLGRALQTMGYEQTSNYNSNTKQSQKGYSIRIKA